MSHTEAYPLARDYLSGDGTLSRDLMFECLATKTDVQLADEVIEAWELGDPDHDGSGPSWLGRHADRDDIVAAFSRLREHFDDEFPG